MPILPRHCRPLHRTHRRVAATLVRAAAAGAFAATLAACGAIQRVDPSPPPELADAPRWAVQARKWLPDGKLAFGPFRTEAFDARTSTSGTDCVSGGCGRFAVRVGDGRHLHSVFERELQDVASHAKTRIAFTLDDTELAPADVRAVRDLDVHHRESLLAVFHVPLEARRTDDRLRLLAGEVQSADGPAWRFVAWQTERDGAVTSGGWLGDAAGGHAMALESWHAVEYQVPATGLPLALTPGWAVRQQGHLVAALDLVSRQVWMRPDLPPAMRRAIAGCFATLVLQREEPAA